MSKKSSSTKKPSTETSTAASSASKSAVDPNAEREALFQSLADPEDPETISIEGLGALCEKLGIDASADVRALVLAMKLGSKSKPGRITHEEFLEACKRLQVSNEDQIRAKLPALDPGFMEANEFRGDKNISQEYLQ
jgi:hypothetical protein